MCREASGEGEESNSLLPIETVQENGTYINETSIQVKQLYVVESACAECFIAN